ncbi:MAG: hypothetical protein F4Y01_06755 [Gammaproteobacteria bacterium]|nr:hypothetical protein [Gammaproteobacteria bacterium]
MKSVASLGALFLLAACPGERAVLDSGEPSPLATDDAAYLVQLGLIRGHLRVGHALLEAGADAAAATHSKHPSDELYADLEAAFEARGKPGFAAALSELATAFEAGDLDDASAAHDAVREAISDAESGVAVNPVKAANVILGLLRVAAWEYGVGIADGEVANAHEYQDAWGFTQTAKDWAARLAESGESAPVFSAIQARLAELEDLWPELVPSEVTPAMNAARLYGVAAEVEIMALELTR